MKLNYQLPAVIEWSGGLPVVTLANVARIIEREYREECVDRLIEIALYLENYLGVSRLFIP
jgi:hypothetical protein